MIKSDEIIRDLILDKIVRIMIFVIIEQLRTHVQKFTHPSLDHEKTKRHVRFLQPMNDKTCRLRYLYAIDGRVIVLRTFFFLHLPLIFFFFIITNLTDNLAVDSKTTWVLEPDKTFTALNKM